MKNSSVVLWMNIIKPPEEGREYEIHVPMGSIARNFILDTNLS